MPSLYFVLTHGTDVVSYYHNSKKTTWPHGPYTKGEFNPMYGFTAKCLETVSDREEISSETWDVAFVIFPLCTAFPRNYQGARDYLVNLVRDIREKSTIKKLVFIDNSDEPLDSTNALSEFDLGLDVVLKREYNSQVENYTDLFVPFPYVALGYKDPLWLLNEKKWFKPTEEKLDRVYYAGSSVRADDPINRNYHNRKKLLQDCAEILTTDKAVSGRQYANDKYMDELATSRFCMYPRGCAKLTRRLFEILSVGSLALIQNNGIVMNFVGNGFAREVHFDLPSELRLKVTALRNDPSLYDYCMLEQDRVCEENYTYDAIRKYILRYVE